MSTFAPNPSEKSPRHHRWLNLLARLCTVAMLLLAAATVRTSEPTLHTSADGQVWPELGAAGDAEEDDGEYKLSSLRVLNRAVLHIKEQYVDPKRVVPKDMLLAGLEAVEKQVAEVVVDDSAGPDTVTISVGKDTKAFDVKSVDSLWEMSFKLRDVFRFIEPRLPPDQDRKEVEYATINGMLSTLDPHSVLLPPQTFEEMKMTTSGEFGGLGIVIGLREGALTIISPMDGTPAAEVGLEAKDTIVKIGDESTVNMALDDAVKRLRGKPGTQVTIWVLRKGWSEPRRYSITRAIIKIINVTHKLLEGNVGYVKVKNFQQDTATDVQDALRKMASEAGQSLSGMILDLRNNPGGLLEQAVDLSDLFLDSGVIVTTVGEGNKVREEKTARWAGTERDLPVVVLVNGGSASASEIVAGALKNQERGLVVGTTTFGKGSVQTLLNFKDQSALKLTIAQYLTPGDISIQSIGIVPDVELAPTTVGKDYVDLFPDTSGGREKDLEKHLDDTRALGGKPELVLRHLEEPPPEDDEPDARELSDKFKVDFEIDFARKVLQQAGPAGKTRKGLLGAAQKVSATITAEEEEKVLKQLQPLGVDWTQAPPMDQATGAPRVSARVIGTAAGEAGSTMEIKLEVQNEGPGTLHRLRGTSESDNHLFDDREFLFGKLAPGEKREWSVKVKVPKDAPSRSDDVTVTFGEARDRVPPPLTVRTSVKELPRPSFTYTAFLDDTKGNGDGQLNPGESVDLVVTVTNQGPGLAEEPLVLLKNLGGRELFIREGRAKLEKLAPGQSVTTKVSFDAQADVKRMVEMRLTVLDGAMAEYVAEKLTFPVMDPVGAPVKMQKGTATLGQDLALLAEASAQSPAVARVKKGSKLGVERLVGEFARVDLGEGRFAFAPLSALKVAPGKDAPKPAAGSISYTLLHRAPEMSVTAPAPGMATKEGTLTLTATVTDARGLRDAFIFVNDQKVFFRPLGGPAGAGKPSTFEATLPLKKGTNVVNVVARVDNETSARRTLVIHREGPPETVARQVEPGATRRR
ncbi:MAG: MXAN_5808 family serine peptidase [Myxococcota bacterium]